MQEALALVRQEMGPDAAVLHTRQVRRRILGLFPGRQEIELTASREVAVPSRLPPPAEAERTRELSRLSDRAGVRANEDARLSHQVQTQLSSLQALVKDLCRRSKRDAHGDWPEELFRLFAELLDADFCEEIARELVERLRYDPRSADVADAMLLKARLAGMLEDELRTFGPIRLSPGRMRVAALIGPTGVGKTTTIAKLAANFRLKEKRRVGLITLDTFRIAAVEQLRTYAEIIDLPMFVVSSAREMHEALERLNHLDLVLIDTAGRSPRDEIRIQELKMLLNGAADEIHLVLSSVSATRTLEDTAARFAVVGPTALIMTKLDEADSLGGVLPVLRSSGLPLSYVTDGQNVPDDIAVAEARKLARLMLRLDES